MWLYIHTVPRLMQFAEFLLFHCYQPSLQYWLLGMHLQHPPPLLSSTKPQHSNHEHTQRWNVCVLSSHVAT